MMISDQLEIVISRFSKWAGSASEFVAALLSDDFDQKEMMIYLTSLKFLHTVSQNGRVVQVGLSPHCSLFLSGFLRD